MNDDKSPKAEWDDARVQIVYDLLCSEEMPPNPEQHWEGWTAQRIVAALSSPSAPPADSPGALLPHAYLFAKVAMVMPLFEEARDALTALREDQRIRHGISKTLADRMDIAGTFSIEDWRALSAKEQTKGSGDPAVLSGSEKKREQ